MGLSFGGGGDQIHRFINLPRDEPQPGEGNGHRDDVFGRLLLVREEATHGGHEPLCGLGLLRSRCSQLEQRANMGASQLERANIRIADFGA